MTVGDRTVGLIGAGHAGTSVVAAMVAAGWTVAFVAGRRADSDAVLTAAAQWDVPAVELDATAGMAAVVVIATPDSQIEPTARALAATVLPDTLVVHLSGARGVDALAALACPVGGLHPLQTFATRFDGPALAGGWCAVAGDDRVEALARELGMTPFRIEDDDRASYHAAACVASNHLVALIAQVEAITAVPRVAFGPLMRATIENALTMGPAAALTGPVARGDVDTVQRHLRAIPETERDAYLAMARRTAVLAGRAEEFGEVLA